jgi:predicted anti-sigma-YlaC factor YlaD
VTCERWREAISAIADGEDPGVDQRLVDAHLTRCRGCREFRSQLDQVRVPLRIGPAEPMPDLSGRVVKLNAFADRAGRWGFVRGMLAVVAVEILVLSLRPLVFGEEYATSEHAARHLGAFTAAYGAALLVVAIRPARARTVLPVALTLALALLLAAVVDVVDGRAPLWGETLHFPEILSVVLVWLLAAPSRRLGGSGQVAGDARAVLRMVEHPPEGRETGTSGGA